MYKIPIQTCNIPHQHQDDLLTKLRVATHPLFKDDHVINLVKDEIDNRKKSGTWLKSINPETNQLDSNLANEAGDTS